MIAFIIGAVAMTVLALLWMLPSLLRHRPQFAADAAETNLAVLRDQFSELERDAANGLLSPQQLEAARDDLERRVLEDARVPAQTLRTGASKRAAIALAVALPLAAGLLYWTLGSPDALSPGAVAGGGDATKEQIEDMLKKLEARLAQSPEDGKGWAMLARSNLVMQRYAEASNAYARAATLITDDAGLLADYADALAMAQGRRIEGKALEIVEQALRVDPTQWKALAMAGSAAFERKDYRKAIGYWETLQKRPGLDVEFMRSIATSIEEARQLAGGKAGPRIAESVEPKAPPPKTAGGSGSSVSGTIKLDPAFASKVAPTDTVFIYARAAQGPRAPLAVLRRQIKDLPVEFKLDDSMAMSPEMRLSKFSEVLVGARVSKDGEARPKSGDPQGQSKPVKTGTTGIVVVIDGTVP